MELARQGRYKIIYVAPERLMTESFLSLIQAVEISMVAVDKAHCISQWHPLLDSSNIEIQGKFTRFNIL